jgi:hypothetical protein
VFFLLKALSKELPTSYDNDRNSKYQLKNKVKKVKKCY